MDDHGREEAEEGLERRRHCDPHGKEWPTRHHQDIRLLGADADTSAGWLELFRDLGYNKDDLEELVLKGVDRPLLMKGEANEALVRDIALRYEESEENAIAMS